jgi:hypothetical protein
MFPTIASVFILISVPLFVYARKHTWVFTIAMLSFFTDFMLIDILGYKFWCAGYICIWYLIIEKKNFIFDRTIFGRFLWIELLTMALVGGYFVAFAPWEDSAEGTRKITQQLPLRTVVGIIRFIEVNSFFYCFYNFFKNKYITLDYVVKLTFIIATGSLIIGSIDLFILNGDIRIFLMPTHYVLNRFTGLTGEPRAIGQIMLFCIFIFLAFGIEINNRRYLKRSIIGILVAFTGVGLSFSSTAVGYGTITLAAYALSGKMRLKYVLPLVVLYSVSAVVLLDNEGFVTHQNARLTVVNRDAANTQVAGVPEFFNSFEVFDKLALVFLYFNPQYALLGVGPNTVNIPSSKYLNGVEDADFEGKVDSVPVTFVINVLSRSGIWGLSLYFYAYFLIQSKLKRHPNKMLTNFFFLMSVYTLIYNNIFYFASVGLVLGVYFSDINNTNKKIPKLEAENQILNAEIA